MPHEDQLPGLPLEDELSDILGKAMKIKGMDTSTLSAASGIEWGRLEHVMAENSATAEELDLLAQALDLKAAALRAIGDGWHPGAVAIPWEGIRGFPSPFMDWTVNSFVIWDPEQGVAGVIDTGTEVGKKLSFLEDRGLDVRFIFLTHGHGDHVSRLGKLRERFPEAQVWLGPGEHMDGSDALIVGEGKTTEVGRLKIRVLETPGHTSGGLTFVISGWKGQPAEAAFVGDALFAGSIGRPNVSHKQLLHSISSKIMRLPAETLLGCGHGPYTTVGQEQQYNPFL